MIPTTATAIPPIKVTALSVATKLDDMKVVVALVTVAVLLNSKVELITNFTLSFIKEQSREVEMFSVTSIKHTELLDASL